MRHPPPSPRTAIASLAIALATALTSTAAASNAALTSAAYMNAAYTNAALTSGNPASADAQVSASPVVEAPAIEPTLEQLEALRAVLATYEDVELALEAGFERFGDCMRGPQGAQGIHFTHGERIGETSLDVLQPEVLMYEPRADGSLRLIGAEYLVFQQAWHDARHDAPPVLLGREFTLNTTLLDEPFYALHVWVWQHNPLGLFANWNPLVRCDQALEASH